MVAYGGKELAAAFRTVRKNTVQVSEEIPEDQYDFVAAPGVRSVRALVAHIVWGPTVQQDMHRVKRVFTLRGYDFDALTGQGSAFEAKRHAKAELVSLLTSEGERFASWLEGLSPEFLNETYTDPMGQNPKSRFEGLMAAKEHEMHHRGQLMLIQRMLGLVPHLTRVREQRRAARLAAAKM